MRCKIGLCLLLIITLGLTACGGENFQDNQVYVVEQGGKLEEDTVVGWLDIENTTPFEDENRYQSKLAAGQLFLTASADGQLIFYEELVPEQDIAVLKGPGRVLVNLYVADQNAKTVQLIAEHRPFITKIGWNPNEQMVAFCGENMLTVYDTEKKKTMLEEDLASEAVSAFFWSPLESRKLYLEQPYNSVGLLYYIEPKKKAELYETAERLYYKARLDDTYFYGTRWGMDDDNHESIYTVISNEEKETVKVVGKGSYRDHYQRSVLLSGEDNFGLTYIANVNQVSKSVSLTDQYVYDAKFVAGGNSIFVTAAESRTKNQYVLHLVDSEGAAIKEWLVSGSSILLSEDGTIGYSSGPEQEVINFSQRAKQRGVALSQEDKLEKTLRGASSIYAELALGQQVSQQEQEQFYANLEGLTQIPAGSGSDDIRLTYSARLLMMEENEQGRLCLIALNGFNNQQQQIQQQMVVQLVEHNHIWYVLHFETGDYSDKS